MTPLEISTTNGCKEVNNVLLVKRETRGGSLIRTVMFFNFISSIRTGKYLAISSGKNTHGQSYRNNNSGGRIV